jgi:dTDP-4-dehydrorhamnose 3,5-epimerase
MFGIKNEKLTVHDLALQDLKLIRRHSITDERGFMQRLYCNELLRSFGLSAPLSQINLTLTRRCGAVRGMHFQCVPHAEDKVVTCLRGRVFDVAVDLRKNSPTFLKWHAEILSPELNNSLFIPKGFAHGFQALAEDSELLYFHTAAYAPQAEGGLSPLDPALHITWPLEITDMSDRDRSHPLLSDKFEGFINEM